MGPRDGLNIAGREKPPFYVGYSTMDCPVHDLVIIPTLLSHTYFGTHYFINKLGNAYHNSPGTIHACSLIPQKTKNNTESVISRKCSIFATAILPKIFSMIDIP
jgi:hypothetical protein